MWQGLLQYRSIATSPYTTVKCLEPLPAHMQVSMCALEGHVTLAKMAENSLKF